MSRNLARSEYTVDGGGVGELEFENFNAASVNIAKSSAITCIWYGGEGVMVNALSLGRGFTEVPADEAPETAEGYEVYHLASMKAPLTGPKCAHHSRFRP